MQTQSLARVMAFGLLIAAACGGPQSAVAGGTPDEATGEGVASDAGDSPDAGAMSSPAPAAPVTFVIKNSGSDTLFLNMDKGLQAVISGFSGKRPNATQLLLFPKHCTASCDSSPDLVCPVCEKLKQAKAIKAAEKHEPIKPGALYEVPWDGVAFKYQHAKGNRKGGCDCFETLDPEPQDYTILACGLRKTKSAKTRSQYLCVEASLTLPITKPVRLEFDFGTQAP